MSRLPHGAPRRLEDLREWLIASGFRTTSDVRGGMGGLQLSMIGQVPHRPDSPLAEIEITADRSDWAVALRFEGMTRFINAAVWAAYVVGSPVGAPDPVSGASFLVAHLADAADSFMDHKSAEADLIALGADYMRGRYRFLSDLNRR